MAGYRSRMCWVFSLIRSGGDCVFSWIRLLNKAEFCYGTEQAITKCTKMQYHSYGYHCKIIMHEYGISLLLFFFLLFFYNFGGLKIPQFYCNNNCTGILKKSMVAEFSIWTKSHNLWHICDPHLVFGVYKEKLLNTKSCQQQMKGQQFVSVSNSKCTFTCSLLIRTHSPPNYC